MIKINLGIYVFNEFRKKSVYWIYSYKPSKSSNQKKIVDFLTILCYVRDFYRQANQELQITNGYSSKSKRENSYLNPMNV